MSNLYLNQSQFEDIFKNHLKIETYSKPIESLYSFRNRNRIDYKPYYQRNYVWDENKASYFIESILLGTEIPPLIFFNNGDTIEIIDGRQRFETIKLFMDNKIKLKHKGLSALKSLENLTYETLPDKIRDSFLDSTLRIIEFEIVNEPKLDPLLQDKVKKEIFSRYNTGITPLKKYEIDNAVYDEDSLTNIFKASIKQGSDLYSKIYDVFFKDTRLIKQHDSGASAETIIMQFVRKNIIMHKIPITYYASGKKNEIYERLYDQLVDNEPDHSAIFKSFCYKINVIKNIYDKASARGIILNRLFYECLLWMLYVLDNEDISLSVFYEDSFISDLLDYANNNHDMFSDIDYLFYAKVVGRYNSILKYASGKLNIDLTIYQSATNQSKQLMKQLMKDDENDDKMSQLESLRLNKPEPSRTSIEDISRMMNRRKFLVRPSYQRSEVINLTKASSIIESILLGITLPAIFVFKRENGISEVIDGQQRILTILGFIGQEYINDEGLLAKPKNTNFSLRDLKILTEFKGKKFNELPPEAQDKILDFELFVVTIDQNVNQYFDPIDLFIRLNDKPYPIKEHSFEMWNSWVDKDIVTSIKNDVTKSKDWFYLRTQDRIHFRDRMENEEIYITLAYLYYKDNFDKGKNYLDIYQKEQRLNARISDKRDISLILSMASTNDEIKYKIIESIRNVRSFVKKVKLLLITSDIEEIETDKHLKLQLDKIFNALNRKAFRRTYQDFYLLWKILSPLTFEIIKSNRHEIRKEVENIMLFVKKIPDTYSNGSGVAAFGHMISTLKEKFSICSRKISLSDNEIKQMIVSQGNVCPISGTPLYWGDDIEVDHIVPIALGGKDCTSNLQVVHKDSNRKKGCSII